MFPNILVMLSNQRWLATISLAVLVALPDYAQAQNNQSGAAARVSCASDGGYRHCAADTRDGVELYRQLSNSVCRYNETWGYDKRGVWVNQGCRAEFQLHSGRSGGDGKDKKNKDSTAAVVGGVVALGVIGAALSADNNGDNNKSDRRRDPGPPPSTIRCESDGDYQRCRANVDGRVRLYRQLSRASCDYNETWGYDRRGIWVDRGCRAEFTLD